MVIVLSWLIAIPMLGFLTGARSMTPMAVVCWFAYMGHLGVRHSWWAFWAALPITAIVFSVFAVGEMIVDKLPRCPNRTDAFALGARIVFGGLVGALAATCMNGSAIEGIFLGAVSALVGTFITYHTRHFFTHNWGWNDLPVAIGEDLVVLCLSILAMGFVTA